MSQYRVATGHGLVYADTELIVPQPASVGVEVTERSFGADGTVHDRGAYIELQWALLQGTSMYVAVMTQFGLHTTKRAAVTAWLRDDLFIWRLYEGWAIRPQQRWAGYFPRDVRIIIRDLEVTG
jgi:hypothetical protein